jgi:hypothetical protein
MIDDDDCGPISGMSSRETEVLGENLLHFLFICHKSHMA